MQPSASLVDQTLKEFQRLTRKYALFHAVFFSAFIGELLTILIFMSFLAKTIGLAIVVAATFLTVFTYFVLRFYFQTQKPEQFAALRDRFLNQIDHSQPWSVERSIRRNLAPSGASEDELSIMGAEGVVRRPASLNREESPPFEGGVLQKWDPVYQLLQKLQGQESQCYLLPPFFQTLTPLVEKFSVWCHWEDVQWMKETLHFHALQKLLNGVKFYPTDLELHRCLAGAYMALYQIYELPSGPSPFRSFIVRQYQSSEMRGKFEKAAYCALEELKIVLVYLPHDFWALTQMAKVYHDLGLRQEEKKTYEALLSLKSEDADLHYQLGKLYFELGEMAQGLQLYHQLQGRKDPKAQDLIQHYDAYHLSR